MRLSPDVGGRAANGRERLNVAVIKKCRQAEAGLEARVAWTTEVANAADRSRRPDLVATIEKEAAVDTDVAKPSAGALSQQCTTCHGTIANVRKTAFRFQFAAF